MKLKHQITHIRCSTLCDNLTEQTGTEDVAYSDFVPGSIKLRDLLFRKLENKIVKEIVSRNET